MGEDTRLREALKNAWLAGFAYSSEGWNGEHPMNDRVKGATEKHATDYAGVAISLLDAARTEGRGEPIAWAFEYEENGKWVRDLSFLPITDRDRETTDYRNVQPLYASPFREPEISREAVDIEKVLRQATIDYNKGAAAPGVGIHEFSAQRVSAILNLAPVGGRGGGSKALADVAAERQRQMEVEGWTPEHDDSHGGDLLTAAVCYAQRRMDEDRFGVFSSYAPAAWPWDASWWKPKDRRRDLIRAAALLVAEIERLDRLPPPPQEQHQGGTDGR